MTDRQILFRTLLILADTITPWKWRNRDCYPVVRQWEEIAKAIDFPLGWFEDCLDKGTCSAFVFTEGWLREQEADSMPDVWREDLHPAMSPLLNSEEEV